MSRRHFDSTENAELRAKIDEAKRRLPMPALMARLGLGEHAKKEAHCPWHSDEHPSFSAFQKADGTWWQKCFVGCSQGDEIALLVKHLNISRREAIRRYLDMADFPALVGPKSHEYPKSPASPASLSICVSVSLSLLVYLCILCLLCPKDKDLMQRDNGSLSHSQWTTLAHALARMPRENGSSSPAI
jgi:hypothetical protein